MKKSDKMVENVTKIYPKMKSKILLIIEKNNIEWCFFKVSIFQNMRKALYLENIRNSFGVSISWKIRNFLGVGCFNFLGLIRKVQGFFFGNIRKASFWENIRSFLILELESSISWNTRNFFQRRFALFFDTLGWKVHQVSLLLSCMERNSIKIFETNSIKTNVNIIKTFEWQYSIEQQFISKIDILSTFDFIYHAMTKILKVQKDKGEVKAKMLDLANTWFI